MNNKIKKVLGIISFVALFALVVYIKTERKLKRTGIIEPDNTEEMNRMIDISKQKEKEAFDLSQEIEKQKRDSLQEIQKKKMEEQLKKTKEIMKELDKEIKEQK